MKIRLALAASFLIPVLSGCGSDESSSMGGARPPLAAAYVRFIDLTKGGATAKLGNRSLSAGNLQGGVVPFQRVPVKTAVVSLEAGSKKTEEKTDFAADSVRTVFAVDSASGAKLEIVLGEAQVADQATATVSVVNLLETPLSVTQPGTGSIQSGKSGASLKLSAGPLSFAASVNGKPVKIDPVELKSGEAYTVVVDLRDGKPEAFLLQNTAKMVIVGPSGSSPTS
jgi:hypothetical protein